MKKLTIPCALLTSLGLSAAAVATPFDGFYANLGIGGTSGEFKHNQYSAWLIDDGVDTFALEGGDNADVYGNSWTGVVGAGYRFCVTDGFILGLEVNADIQNTKGHSNFFADEALYDDATGDELASVTVSGRTTSKLENNFSLLVKPMYMVGPKTALYALVGPKWGNFKTSTEARLVTEVLDVPVIDSTVSDSESDYTLGVTAGLGIEHYVADQFSIALEWNYTNYGDIETPNLLAGDPTPGADGDLLVNDISDVEAQTNAVFFKVAYTFS